jgi:hypothetical protein
MSDTGTPFPRTAEQIREDLERLRKQHPKAYARTGARLLKELERSRPARPRYAKT